MNIEDNVVIDERFRGTFTILADKSFVIGIPSRMFVELTDEEIIHLKTRSENWLKEGGVLIFPFPVDVIDMRKHE